jgi:tetratricopeptide (TPR) repeat protein
MIGMCADGEMEALMRSLGTQEGAELQQVDRLLAAYPEDPRLHFLRGSLLAGIGRSIEALPALKRAVELGPDFAIARFQLGFFQLTSGEAGDALETWGPLALLPADHYLRLFVGGLVHLIRDEFAAAADQLRTGIAANAENLPLNADMQRIIDQIEPLIGAGETAAGEGDEAASATSFLLDQFSGGRRPH